MPANKAETEFKCAPAQGKAIRAAETRRSGCGRLAEQKRRRASGTARRRRVGEVECDDRRYGIVRQDRGSGQNEHRLDPRQNHLGYDRECLGGVAPIVLAVRQRTAPAAVARNYERLLLRRPFRAIARRLRALLAGPTARQPPDRVARMRVPQGDRQYEEQGSQSFH